MMFFFCDFELYSADCCFPRSFFLSLAYYYKRRFVFLYIPRALTVGVCGRDLSPNALLKRNSPLLQLSSHDAIRVVSCLLRSDKYAICCVLVLVREAGAYCNTVPFLFLSLRKTDAVSVVQKSLLSSVNIWQSSGAYAEFRKATVSFVITVCQSVWNTSAPTGRIFMKFHILIFFF